MSVKKKKDGLLAPIICIAVALLVLGAGITWYLLRDNSTPAVESEVTQQEEELAEAPKVATKAELLAEVNKRRAEVGVAALQYSPALEQSAQIKCDDMVNRNYWDHVDPDGKDGVQIAMDIYVIYGTYGENLITRHDSNKSAQNVFDQWFTSQPHKDAALNVKYTLTGFGVCNATPVDAQGSVYDNFYIVEHFYSPQAL